MIELYKAEIQRFARGALGLGVLHAAALFLLDRAFPWMRDDAEIAVVAAFTYALAGAIFGIYQCASYTRTSHWIALLHRPLAPWRIMAAVSGAGATLLFTSVLAPLVVFTAALSLQAGRVVDARHWPLALGGALFGLLGFGVGSYLALAPRRYGWTALVAVSVLTVDPAGAGPGVLWLPSVIIAVLALLMAGAFKPDRSLPPTRPGLLVPTAAVAALSFHFIVVGGIGVAYPLGLAAVGRDPEATPPAGGLVEARRSPGSDLLAGALAAATGPHAAMVRAQLRGAPVTRLPVALDELPTRGEMTNTGPIRFTDAVRGIEWIFRHDHGAFEGLRLRDRRHVGELRPDPAFDAPPLLVGEGRMISGARLYGFDPSAGAIVRQFQVRAGETIVAAPVTVGSTVSVLSDRALYFIDPPMLTGGAASRPLTTVPLPGLIGDLQRLDVAPLPDRIVVAFLFGAESLDGPSPARQHVVAITPDGTVHTLVERSLGPDHPDALRFRSYWISPVLRGFTAAVEAIGSGPAWTAPRAPVQVPRGVWFAAALLSLAAAAAAAQVAVRRRLRPAACAGWTLAVLALGLSMLAAFYLMSRKPRLTT